MPMAYTVYVEPITGLPVPIPVVYPGLRSLWLVPSQSAPTMAYARHGGLLRLLAHIYQLNT